MCCLCTSIFRSRTRLLTIVSACIDAMQQKGELVLRARVARCIDGMDLNLYEQALQLMRAHVRSAQPVAMDV